MLGAFASKEENKVANPKHECVQNIELDKLRPFPDHPFIVRDDEQMQMLTESIRTVGVPYQ